MEKTKNKGNIIAAVIAVSVIAFFALVLIIPASREVFKSLSSSHPYIMGFLKFGLLASCGEIFALRIKRKSWAFPNYFHFRVLIWGAIGIAITFMMKVYTYGVVGMMEHGLLPALKNTESFWNSLLRAFFTAAVMNLTFGPTFMAVHKCSDRVLDMIKIKEKVCIESVIGSINWSAFVRFTLIKTVPLFWIPAHTVTFLLPEAYQVVLAAFLSVALGIILSFGTKKRSV